MPSQYSPEDLVIARMKELADLRTSWHRSLWQVGTVVGLGEIIEATTATWSGQLTSPEAMKDFVSGHKSQILLDHGLGDGALRQRIADRVAALPVKPGQGASDGRPGLASVEELRARARHGYLLRWASHIDTESVQPAEVEVIARLVVSHLLDEGFHRSHIHGWLTNLPRGQSLVDTLEAGHEMLGHELRDFNLLIGVRAIPRNVVNSIENIRVEPDEFIAAFRSASNVRSFSVPRLPSAAIALSFRARDPHSAISDATAWIRTFSDRVAVGTGGSESVFEQDIVDVTTNKIRSFRDERRLVRVPSLQRNGLYTNISAESSASDQIDDAIGLLAAQQQGTSAASIASAWAAVEALLGMPGARGVDAADRLADIVACSFPRAELTELVGRWAKFGSGDLHESLNSEPNSFSQASLMLNALLTTGDPGFAHASDVAAVNRLAQLNGDKSGVIKRVRGYYRSAFRRLYYQRNFIMHAAKFDSVSLRSTTRSAPQLVAAGVDRIVNARFGPSKTSPLALAARADNEIELLGSSGERPIHALLED